MSSVMMCEGIDLVVFSSLIPAIIADSSMGIDKAAAGVISSMTFMGMFVGGIAAGRVSGRLGYLKTILYGMIWFSIAMVGATFAPGAIALGIARLVAGLGLGVVLPVAMAFARLYCEERYAAIDVSVVMAGIPLGGLVAALLVSGLFDVLSWRTFMAIAGGVGIVMAIGICSYLRRIVSGDAVADGRQQACRKDAGTRGTGTVDPHYRLFRSGAARTLILFSAVMFAFLMAYYGLSTWLTQLMREFHLPMTSSLQMTIMLNFGCVLGSLLTAFIATVLSPAKVALCSALVAAICMTGIALKPESQSLLFVLVFFAGVGAISAQNLTNTLVSTAFPADMRASALGFALGIGRLGAIAAPAIGGFILQSGFDAGVVLIWLGLTELAGMVVLALRKKRLCLGRAQAVEETGR
jgi:AAHS family benzoate transporter-like MFS transporter